MAEFKLLMPFGDSTIVEQTIDNFLNSGVHEIIVVLGYRADDVRQIIADRPVRLAFNPNYREGMSTSIAAGLKSVGSQAQAVMLGLADQPLIDSQTIRKLKDGFYRHNKGIIIPTYRGQRGHPVVFAIKYKEKLLALTGDIGGKQIVKDSPGDILEVTVKSRGVLVDIDSAESYHLERDRLNKRRR